MPMRLPAELPSSMSIGPSQNVIPVLLTKTESSTSDLRKKLPNGVSIRPSGFHCASTPLMLNERVGVKRISRFGKPYSMRPSGWIMQK